jgi:hypothetical protein
MITKTMELQRVNHGNDDEEHQQVKWQGSPTEPEKMTKPSDRGGSKRRAQAEALPHPATTGAEVTTRNTKGKTKTCRPIPTNEEDDCRGMIPRVTTIGRGVGGEVRKEDMATTASPTVV